MDENAYSQELKEPNLSAREIQHTRHSRMHSLYQNSVITEALQEVDREIAERRHQMEAEKLPQ